MNRIIAGRWRLGLLTDQRGDTIHQPDRRGARYGENLTEKPRSSSVSPEDSCSHALTLAQLAVSRLDLCAKPSTTAYPGTTEDAPQETIRLVKEAGCQIVAEVADTATSSR